MTRTRVSDLDVDTTLFGFVEQEALPGSGVGSEAFWSGYAKLVRDLGPRNRQLLAIREDLQARIDSYLRERRGTDLDEPAYLGFLR